VTAFVDLAASSWLGRRWAVNGQPMVTNGQWRPFDRRSVLPQCRSREVIPGWRHFLRNKRQEWEEYRSEVTAFELRKNLPVL
jgi:hypothetical protein